MENVAFRCSPAAVTDVGCGLVSRAGRFSRDRALRFGDLGGERSCGHDDAEEWLVFAMKDKALARLREPDTKVVRYRPPNTLMQLLQEL